MNREWWTGKEMVANGCGLLCSGIQESAGNSSGAFNDFRTDIWTRDLPNTRQGCQPFCSYNFFSSQCIQCQVQRVSVRWEVSQQERDFTCKETTYLGYRLAPYVKHVQVLQKELYNFVSLYKFIQRTCTVFWTVSVAKHTEFYLGWLWLNVTSTGNAADL
jgi:hypothetical protein